MRALLRLCFCSQYMDSVERFNEMYRSFIICIKEILKDSCYSVNKFASMWYNFAIMNLTVPLIPNSCVTGNAEELTDYWASLTMALFGISVSKTLEALKLSPNARFSGVVYILLILMWAIDGGKDLVHLLVYEVCRQVTAS